MSLTSIQSGASVNSGVRWRCSTFHISSPLYPHGGLYEPWIERIGGIDRSAATSEPQQARQKTPFKPQRYEWADDTPRTETAPSDNYPLALGDGSLCFPLLGKAAQHTLRGLFYLFCFCSRRIFPALCLPSDASHQYFHYST